MKYSTYFFILQRFFILLFFAVHILFLSAQTNPGGAVLQADPITGDIRDLPPRTDVVPCFGYTEPGSTINEFDWKATSYSAWIFPNNSNVPPTQPQSIPSPYFSNNLNVLDFGFFLNGQPRDFEPEDGWELLYYNLGNSQFAVEEPSFGLYNRLEGRVIIFWYLQPNDGSGPENVFVRLDQVITQGNNTVTGYFSTLNIPSNTLDNITSNFPLGFQQLNEGFAGQQWYYAEGMMAYDPCVCDYETGIVTEAVTTDISQLQFSGDISGQSQAVYSTPSSSGSKSFLGNAIRRADGLAGAIAGGYKRYKTLDSLESDLDLENSSSGFVRTLADFLPTGFLGPVGGALKVIGFLAGKKKPATPPQLLGFNHNFSFTATGTITSTSRYSPYPMYSPGSDFNEQQLQAFRPIYDNPLGVFTVLERPKVQFYEEEFLNGTLGDLDFGYVERGFYRFSGDLKYRVNKTAGLSELPVSVAAALIWTDGCQAFDNGVADSVASVAGPAINLACFDDQIVRIGTINGVSGLNGFRCSGSPQIQIIATLEEEDGDIQTLFAARYPVELEEIKAEDVDWTLGVAAQLDPNPASYCISDAPPLPVNDQELFQFCRSRYDPILTLVVGPEDEEDSSLETGLTGNVVGEIQSSIASDVFPNPVRDRLWLGIPDELVNQNVLFTLTDMSGRILIQTNRTFTVPGKNMLPIEWNEYTPGLYLITISDGENYLQTFRVTKQ